jgi:hypothetical protein
MRCLLHLGDVLARHECLPCVRARARGSSGSKAVPDEVAMACSSGAVLKDRLHLSTRAHGRR